METIADQMDITNRIISKTSSNDSKISMLGWWIVQTIVLPVSTMFLTVLITIAAALASSPDVGSSMKTIKGNLQKAIEENHKNRKVKCTEIDSSIFQTIVMHCGPKEHTHHDQNDQKKLENKQFSVRTIKISLARVNRIKRGKGSAWVNLKTRTNAFRFSSSICHWKPIFRSSARFTPYVLADKAAGKKPETPNPDLLQKISNIFSRRASKTHKQEEIKSTFTRSLIHYLPFTKQNHIVEQAVVELSRPVEISSINKTLEVPTSNSPAESFQQTSAT
nr:transmembrane protein, putative [Ipomoea batatas]